MIAIINYQLKNVITFEGSWNVWNRLYAKKPNKYPSNIPNLENIEYKFSIYIYVFV